MPGAELFLPWVIAVQNSGNVGGESKIAVSSISVSARSGVFVMAS